MWSHGSTAKAPELLKNQLYHITSHNVALCGNNPKRNWILIAFPDPLTLTAPTSLPSSKPCPNILSPSLAPTRQVLPLAQLTSTSFQLNSSVKYSESSAMAPRAKSNTSTI